MWTWLTPLRSMRKRLMVQLPLLMADSMPNWMISGRMFFAASKFDWRLARSFSACGPVAWQRLHSVDRIVATTMHTVAALHSC